MTRWPFAALGVRHPRYFLARRGRRTSLPDFLSTRRSTAKIKSCLRQCSPGRTWISGRCPCRSVRVRIRSCGCETSSSRSITPSRPSTPTRTAAARPAGSISIAARSSSSRGTRRAPQPQPEGPDRPSRGEEYRAALRAQPGLTRADVWRRFEVSRAAVTPEPWPALPDDLAAALVCVCSEALQRAQPVPEGSAGDWGDKGSSRETPDTTSPESA